MYQHQVETDGHKDIIALTASTVMAATWSGE